MNKMIFIELANTWKSRADVITGFPTEDVATSEVNVKSAEVLKACRNDLLNVIKLFDTLEQSSEPTE